MEFAITYLKSNMDRFIEFYAAYLFTPKNNLKSNMDRFIAPEYL